MSSSGGLRTRAETPASIGSLAVELQRVVDQLESDWSDRHMIGRKTAQDLHDLRLRAELLLSES